MEENNRLPSNQECFSTNSALSMLRNNPFLKMMVEKDIIAEMKEKDGDKNSNQSLSSTPIRSAIQDNNAASNNNQDGHDDVKGSDKPGSGDKATSAVGQQDQIHSIPEVDEDATEFQSTVNASRRETEKFMNDSGEIRKIIENNQHFKNAILELKEELKGSEEFSEFDKQPKTPEENLLDDTEINRFELEYKKHISVTTKKAEEEKELRLPIPDRKMSHGDAEAYNRTNNLYTQIDKYLEENITEEDVKEFNKEFQIYSDSQEKSDGHEELARKGNKKDEKVQDCKEEEKGGEKLRKKKGNKAPRDYKTASSPQSRKIVKSTKKSKRQKPKKCKTKLKQSKNSSNKNLRKLKKTISSLTKRSPGLHSPKTSKKSPKLPKSSKPKKFHISQSVQRLPQLSTLLKIPEQGISKSRNPHNQTLLNFFNSHRPKTDKISNMLMKNASKTHRSTKKKTQHIGEHLFNYSRVLSEERNKRFVEKRIRDEVRKNQQCTFRPRKVAGGVCSRSYVSFNCPATSIHSSQKKKQQMTLKRLEDWVNYKEKKIRAMKELSEMEFKDTHTFRPKVKRMNRSRSSKAMRKLSSSGTLGKGQSGKMLAQNSYSELGLKYFQSKLRMMSDKDFEL
ncbi:unnamed protein product [Moneuplotes crassus]|uniref:Uncharacterized protein n=1 Tax=Euplotes crassus TaxID=5936 RepID=A0AAD1Y8Y6_EUPCR|nr:unnamed protein product [Moneuplotes crassus]